MTDTKRNGNASQRQGQPGLNVQQVLEIGRAASETLNSPIYNLVHRQAVDEIIQEWATTTPKESLKRDDLWREFQAVAKAAMRMQNHVQSAQQALEKQGQEQQRHEAEYLDGQGFGFAEEFGTGDTAPYQ
jgi:hypothetical protein